MLVGWYRLMNALFTPLAIYFSAVPVRSVKTCAVITPESPLVALGSSFTAYCILNESCVREYGQDARNIIWKVKHSKIPEEQYSTINRTVSSVTLRITSLLDSFLTCNVLAFGQIEQSLYGIVLTLGLPPDKPDNVNCIVHPLPFNRLDMTCTWNPGRETFLRTNFTLRARWVTGTWSTPDSRMGHTKVQRNEISRGGRDFECKAVIVNDSCTLEYAQTHIDTEIWVEAENALGKVESAHRTLDPVDLVKLNPPHLRPLNCPPELPSAMRIEWDDSFTGFYLKYTIRYRISSAMEWDEVPSNETASSKTSFMLQGLKPYTEYTVSVRCMRRDGRGYWSDWSTGESVVTSEAQPSRGPDLWQEVYSDSEGKRHVLLKWKELERSDAKGAVLGYRITVTQRIPRSTGTYNTTNTSFDLILTEDAYDVAVTAYNSVGESPKSFLTIPASNSVGLPPVQSIQAFPKDGQLWVEWTAPNASVKGYIIEWCLKSETSCSTIQWQKEPSTSRGAFLRGNIEEMKRYSIHVIPLYSRGHGAVQSTEAYLLQGPPAKGPKVHTKKLGKNEATLIWDPIPLNDQHGFITNYTIIYRPNDGNELSVLVDPSMTEYTLSSLSGYTMYRVRMKASTVKGDKDGPELTFTTLKFAKGEIEAIVVPSCIGFLILTLLGIIVCFSKRDLVKKHIWPNIPDPSKSTIVKMSPHTPSRHTFSSKNQTYPEESFTDVSVVEITADDKKSFSEQDLKPLDLLKKELNASEGHSSGIGGSSCMSSPRQSVSDSEDSESAQTTSSTVQYSTVVLSGYRDQKPAPPVHSFARSESTQPLLESEEKPDDQQAMEGCNYKLQRSQYFKQTCGQDERSPDGSLLEQSKEGLQSLNKDDLVGHDRLQVSGQHSPQSMEEQRECPPGKYVLAEGQAASDCGTLEADLTTSGESKSYLPQIVRNGGYMPQ